MSSTYTTGDPESLLSRLRAALPTLGPSEQRVVRAILDSPTQVIEWSTAELASAARASPATVVRASQNLGFRGYQHLRLELARAPLRADRGAGHPIGAIFSEAADAIRVSRDVLDGAEFDRAVAALATANRLLMVGTGFSSPPIQDAALRFLTAGRRVDAPVDVQAQDFAARVLEPGDVCLAVSYSGANSNTLKACKAAKARGATIIALTSFARSPLTRLTDIVLVTGPVARGHDVDPYLSRISQGLVLHAMQRAIVSRPDDPSLVVRMRDVVADALTDDLTTS